MFGLKYVNWSAVDMSEFPSVELQTCTSTVPGVLAGVTIVICDVEPIVGVTAVPPISTSSPAAKPDPLMLRFTPPTVGPLVAESPVTAGVNICRTSSTSALAEYSEPTFRRLRLITR